MDQRGFDNPASDLLSADAAAQLLGVKRSTLYSYAARGKIESVPTGRNRLHAYRRADVERVKAMAAARAGHGPVAAGALQWGEPVLESAHSGIHARGPIYRGHLAVELAASDVSFERAAELLWGPALPASATWERPGDLGAPVKALLSVGGGRPATPLAALQALLPCLAARDGSPLMLDAEVERRRARLCIRRMAAWMGLPHSAERCKRALRAGGVAEAIAVALGARDRRAAGMLQRALVLLADHELNASSFAARVAASAQADLLACLTAALATFSGPRHGAECDRVEALVSEVGSPRAAARVLALRAARGDATPGFGHRLYPGGDPRSRPLWDAARSLARPTVRMKTLLAIARAVEASTGITPSVDFALVALCTALGLPRGSATGVFAVARTAGWVAHVLEQRRSPGLLRPRARYTGPQVE